MACCGACVEEPKYPRAMRALAEGNSLQSLSACRALDCLCSGSRHAWHGDRDNGPGVNHRSTAQLWGATELVRPARPVRGCLETKPLSEKTLEQRLDTLRRKDSLRGAETAEITVH